MPKVLWAVGMPNADVQALLLAHAKTAGATVVCVRSDNALLPAAIPTFHAAGIAVWAWRWPAVRPPGPGGAPHYYALDEANYVVGTLMPAGLDGYVADIEADEPPPGKPNGINYWNDASLQPLAAEFCNIITAAVAAAKATCAGTFRFGLTAGCEQPTNDPHIPWKTFVDACDTLYPQAYWRAMINGEVTEIHNAGKPGNPGASHARAQNAWGPIANGKPIVCMAGELNLVTPAEIAEYGVLTAGQADRHFYADASSVSDEQLAAVAAL